MTDSGLSAGAGARIDPGAAIRSAAAFFAVGAALVAVAIPVVFIFVGSFSSEAPGAPDAHFTLANWINVYTSQEYLQALGNTAVLSVVVAALSVLLGSLLAWLTVRTDLPAANAFALMLVLPLMISNLITALAWIALAAPNAGFINALSRRWLGINTIVDIYSFGGIIWVLVLHYASFAFISMSAALRSVDASLEEASCMLGVSPLKTSLRMTLPLIRPTITTSFLMIFIFVAENFSVPALLGTPSNYHTLAARIFADMAITPAQPTMAATAGTLLIWIALAGVAWQRHMLKQSARYVTITGKSSHPRMVRLGRMRTAALAAVAGFVFLAVVLPYLTLVFASFLKFLTPIIRTTSFTLENYQHLFDAENITPVWNSLALSGLGGLMLACLYLLLGYLVLQWKRTFGAWVDYITMVPSALPAMIVGIGLVWAFVGSPVPIYGTAAILVLAYFLRFLGYGIRHTSSALLQISGELPEAARMCGARPWKVARDIVLPLVRPSLLSLWTLLFIFIFMEISATIVLYGPETATLPVVLWNDMASGYQTRAFAVAVAQATITFALLLVADRKLGVLRHAMEK